MEQIKDYVIPKYIYVIWSTLIMAFGFGIFRQDWSTVFISLMTLAISLYAVSLSQRASIRIPASLLTAIIIFIYSTLFLGEVHNFYERFWWWDVILHTGSAVGFGLMGAIILILLFRQKKVTASPVLVSVFVFTFALAIGAVWEIFEFAMDKFLGFSMQENSLADTMADLIVDSIGALLAAGVTYSYLTQGKYSALTSILKEAIERNSNYLK